MTDGQAPVLPAGGGVGAGLDCTGIGRASQASLPAWLKAHMLGKGATVRTEGTDDRAMPGHGPAGKALADRDRPAAARTGDRRAGFVHEARKAPPTSCPHPAPARP